MHIIFVPGGPGFSSRAEEAVLGPLLEPRGVQTTFWREPWRDAGDVPVSWSTYVGGLVQALGKASAAELTIIAHSFAIHPVTAALQQTGRSDCRLVLVAPVLDLAGGHHAIIRLAATDLARDQPDIAERMLRVAASSRSFFDTPMQEALGLAATDPVLFSRYWVDPNAFASFAETLAHRNDGLTSTLGQCCCLSSKRPVGCCRKLRVWQKRSPCSALRIPFVNSEMARSWFRASGHSSWQCSIDAVIGHISRRRSAFCNPHRRYQVLNQERLESLASACYDAALGRISWDRILVDVAKVFNGTHVTLLRQELLGTRASVLASAGFELSTVRSYEESDKDLNVFLNASNRHLMVPGLARTNEMTCPDDVLLRSGLNDFLKPIGVRYLMGATVRLDAIDAIHLSVFRAAAAGSATAAERRAILYLAPHVERALQVTEQAPTGTVRFSRSGGVSLDRAARRRVGRSLWPLRIHEWCVEDDAGHS